MAENVQDVPPPVLLAALICDTVILDAMTGKATVVGIFDVINAPMYPVRHDRLFVFCQLTNGRGRVAIRTTLIDLEDDEKVICENTVPAEFGDVRQCHFCIRGIAVSSSW